MARKRINLASIVGAGGSGNSAKLAATRAARAVRMLWAQEARRRLTDVSAETRREYINNIRIESPTEVRPGVWTAQVILGGTLPNIIENGMGPGGVGTWGAYDVRRFVLKGRPYVNVKFNITQADMRRYAQASGVTAGTVLRRVKKATPERTPRLEGAAHHLTVRGERAHRGLVRRIRSRADHVTHVDPNTGRRTRMHRPAHATDPLHGLIRRATRHTAGGPVSTTYTTFRRMSAAGKPWISPGVKPRHIARIVRLKVPSITRHTHGRP